MIKLGAAMWVGVIAVAAGAAFGISFEVQALRDRLGSLNRDIASEEDTIRVLKAEWAYMTQPTRLREMAQKYTELAPIVPAQMLEDAASLPMPLRSPDAAPVDGTPGAQDPAAALVAMMQVPGFGMAPLPARRGVPRTGPVAASEDAPAAAPAAASPRYDAPPPVVAATEPAPVVRRPAAPPPAVTAAPRTAPAVPEDDPIAALLVSFQKGP